jgi:hypothetical protein
MRKSYSIRFFDSCVEALKPAYFEIYKLIESKKEVEKENINVHKFRTLSASKTPKTPKTSDSVISDYFTWANNDETVDSMTQVKWNILEIEIKDEIKRFLDLAAEYKGTTASFWLSNRNKLEKLSFLFESANSIPASSASIERFFSLCGLIDTSRANRMSSDLFKIRCILRANIILLRNNMSSNH